jgi:hypothetical protein
MLSCNCLAGNRGWGRVDDLRQVVFAVAVNAEFVGLGRLFVGR